MTPEPEVVATWLGAHRAEILDAWRGLVFARFAAPAATLLSKPDPFGNPLGSRVQASTEALLEALALGRPAGDLAAAMDPLMRVQAIQGGPPSEAVAFVPLLDRAWRQVRGGVPPGLEAGLKERLDGLMLIAFDVYMRCREDICEIRVRAAHRRVAALVDRLAVAGEGAEP